SSNNWRRRETETTTTSRNSSRLKSARLPGGTGEDRGAALSAAGGCAAQAGDAAKTPAQARAQVQRAQRRARVVISAEDCERRHCTSGTRGVGPRRAPATGEERLLDRGLPAAYP